MAEKVLLWIILIAIAVFWIVGMFVWEFCKGEEQKYGEEE